MSDPRYVPPPEDFLAHGEFLRRLAFQLLRDEHQADDVVQEEVVCYASRTISGAVRRLKNLSAEVARPGRVNDSETPRV